MPADNQKAIGHQLAINNVFGKKTKYIYRFYMGNKLLIGYICP